MTPGPPPPPGGHSIYGSWSWTDSGAQSQPPRDELVRRLWQVVVALSVLIIALVAFAWQYDGGSLNPIARAAEKTQRQPGSRSAIFARVSYEGHPAASFTMRGRGVFNAETARSRVVLIADVPQPIGAVKVSAISDGRLIYMRSRLYTESLPPGRRWMAVDPWLGAGAKTQLPGNGDTQAQLELLEGADGDAEKLGEEDVRGVSTDRYRDTVDFGEYAAVLREEGNPRAARYLAKLAELTPSPATVEAWIDANGLLRRMRIVMSLPEEPGQPNAEMDMQIEFFDFGIAPAIELPKQREVFDTTPLVRDELDLLNGESLGKLRNPESATLSAAVFRRRASKLCRGTERQVKRLERRAEPEAQALKKLNSGSDKDEVLQALGAYVHKVFEPAGGLVNRLLNRFGRLNPPPQLENKHARLLHLGAIEYELFMAMTRATELGDLQLAERLEKRIDRLSDRSDKLAERMGLKACVGDDDESGTSASASSSGSAA